MKEKTRRIIVISVMAIFLFVVSAVYIFKKADDYSDSERRVLAKMPEISFQSILN